RFGNTATGYTGTVGITSSDNSATLSAHATLPNGFGTFNVTLDRAGSSSVTATDTVDSVLSGRGSLSVDAATASSFQVSTVTRITAGTPFNITVRVTDPFGNTATHFTGTVAITSSDRAAHLPANASLTNGIGTFSVTLD